MPIHIWQKHLEVVGTTALYYLLLSLVGLHFAFLLGVGWVPRSGWEPLALAVPVTPGPPLHSSSSSSSVQRIW